VLLSVFCIVDMVCMLFCDTAFEVTQY